MLASQLRNHPAQTAAYVAGELAAASDRLAFMHAENLSVGAAFDLSYADLNQSQQRVFRQLGLVPGPSVDAYAVAALAGIGLGSARRQLHELYDLHLISEPAPGRYELHDLLCEHARALAADDDLAESDAAARRLLDYYVHSAWAAGRHFTSWVYRRQPAAKPPTDVPDLSGLAQASAWLEAERANLYAAADYAIGHELSRHAVDIAATTSGFLSARGYWDESAALHQTAITAARQAGDRLGEAGGVTALGALQVSTGDYPAAMASLTRAVAMFRDVGDRSGQSYALNQLGFLFLLTGDYRAATTSNEQSMELARSANDAVAEAIAISYAGLVQNITGDHPAAMISMQQALALFRDQGSLPGQALARNGLGVIQQETGDYRAATVSQNRALELFRELGELLGQAYALNDLGIVQKEIGDYPAAMASHEQALALFTDLGNRVGRAEALNRLGELASRTSDTARSRKLHTQALAIARNIGAAPEEARALEGLGRSYLSAGRAGQALTHLRQALAIYQHIDAPGALRVHRTLEDHQLTSAEPERKAHAGARHDHS
jgi:tetratricopeptide (TPR) repeat protein